jgi:membrane fusion protein, multidrug efflux system
VLDTSVEQSELENNQAKLKLAQLSYDRDQTLLKRNATSQSVVDSDLANLQQAQAGVDEAKAHISQKTITAPFSGKIGIRQINLGQYVAAGTTMVTLQSLDPLYVRFNLPEQYVADLYLQQPVSVTINGDETSGQTVQGVVTAINSAVDQSTRNILVQATIPNPTQTLYPGMFALVKVSLPAKNNVLVLPQTAVTYSLHGDSVFVIKPEGKKKRPILHAYREYIKVGERRDNEVSIVSGIQPGDQIATSGQIKLQNGTRVAIDNSVELGS